MRAVVLQPMYLPWMGYFGMIDRADVFVFYDDVQFVRNSWQQRNRIKVPESSGEVKWLKVPVVEDFGQEIQAVCVDPDQDWRDEHWSLLRQAYGPETVPFGSDSAPYFEAHEAVVREVYERDWERLNPLNVDLLTRLTDVLGLSRPEFRRSSEFGVEGSGTDRLLRVLETVGADEYVSGPGAKDYLEVDRFEEHDIDLYWHEFDHPEYDQLYGEFKSHLSIVDALFNVGSDETRSLIRQGEDGALVPEH